MARHLHDPAKYVRLSSWPYLMSSKFKITKILKSGWRVGLDTNIPKNVLKIYSETLNFFPKNPSNLKNPYISQNLVAPPCLKLSSLGMMGYIRYGKHCCTIGLQSSSHQLTKYSKQWDRIFISKEV